MTRRLRWVKAMLREVFQERRNYCWRWDNRSFKAFSQFTRSLENNQAKGTSLAYSIPESRRLAPGERTQKHLQNGRTLKEALAGLISCGYQGTAIDPHDYVDLLQRCSKQKDLESVKQVHDCIKKSGLEQYPYVGNSLLKSYIGCGRLQDAQELFSRLSDKNIVGWTIMIGGYAEHDQPEDAFEVYKQLRSEGWQPNAVTYLAVLKACSSPTALKWGQCIHAHILHDGLQANVRVCNALVHMYGKCGSVEAARKVFDEMVERNVISWNAIIGGVAQHGHGQEAFSLFQQMQREGIPPNPTTYLCILNARADPKDLVWVKEVHRHATKAGLAQNLCVNTALIRLYAKCGSMDNAKLVFESMINRDIISWTAMIGGLAQDGRGQEAFALFHQMQREGVVPNAATYMSILNSNACEGALAWVKEVHRHAASSGLIDDLRVGSALVHMYAKSGSIEDARIVFNRMKTRDVISWNAMIGGLSQHGLGHEAYSLFLKMQRKGFKPDSATYVNILNPSCSNVGAFEWVKEVHAHALNEGFDMDLRVGNALIHMYAKIGSIADARQVFGKSLNRDVVSWTVMLGGLAQHGQCLEALKLVEEMKLKGILPHGQSVLAILSACSHAGLVDEGRFLFESMTRDYGIEPAVEHYTSMVDILGRAGHLEQAKLLVLSMPIKPNEVTWKALLGACRLYCNLELAELAAKECTKLEPMDPSPYVLLSNLYAAVGSWDQVSLIRSKMQERGLRKDPGRSWIEVDNKVHYFVSGDTSHPEAREIYAKLNSLCLKMKADCYIPDTSLVTRNIDEDRVSALASHSEMLALAYGLMHVNQGDQSEYLRTSGFAKSATQLLKLSPRSQDETLWPGMPIASTTSKMVRVLVAIIGDWTGVFFLERIVYFYRSSFATQPYLLVRER